ncbi:MAG TPA: hypothetical protein VKB69_03325 [Micromonosporaceae bacterium]|nr:hypothetical protein [Micromonosporaceae bacterium]
MSPPLAVADVTVATSVPVTQGCNVTVDVVGTIHTTGRGGILSYEWTRSDGQSSGVLHQTVPPGDHHVQVHLMWSFGGQGFMKVTATLRVISPATAPTDGTFTYNCV